MLARLLAILGERGRGELIPLVATWVLQAGQGGYLDAFKYLVTAVDMPSLAALQQALKLVALGTPLLRYLVEERSLTSFKEIRIGITGMLTASMVIEAGAPSTRSTRYCWMTRANASNSISWMAISGA